MSYNNLVEIKAPIWKHGKPEIGVADFRIGAADYIDVCITYTRKDGTKSFPGLYRMPADKLLNYPTQIVGGGVKLYVAPLKDWEHINE